MKKIKIKKTSKIKFGLGNFFQYERETSKTIEETTDDQASKKSIFKLIFSLVWKKLVVIIKKMFTVIISAIVNGLIYLHLILKRNEFFYKEEAILW